jgi:hypothetical protein
MLRGALKFSHREDDSACAKRVSVFYKASGPHNIVHYVFYGEGDFISLVQ